MFTVRFVLNKMNLNFIKVLFCLFLSVLIVRVFEKTKINYINKKLVCVYLYALFNIISILFKNKFMVSFLSDLRLIRP